MNVTATSDPEEAGRILAREGLAFVRRIVTLLPQDQRRRVLTAIRDAAEEELDDDETDTD